MTSSNLRINELENARYIMQCQKERQEIIDYNWEYRRKICTRCTRQEELSCFKVNNFIGGIQETHCIKLIKARTSFFKNRLRVFP